MPEESMENITKWNAFLSDDNINNNISFPK